MVDVGTGSLGVEDFKKYLSGEVDVKITDQQLALVSQCYEFLGEFAADKLIYGINTGLGPMAQYRIDDEKIIELQYNLIRSHCSGAGREIPLECAQAMLLARLNTLALGKSGVHPDLIQVMIAMVNHRLTPVIYEHGGVGASGDLVQLAHLALAIIGEGEVHLNGKKVSAQEGFKAIGIEPFEIRKREGLALMNGTSAMSGIGINNMLLAEKLLDWSLACSCMINEIMESYTDHYSEKLNAAKRHQGQQEIARRMRAFLGDSKLTKDRDMLLQGDATKEIDIKNKVQEYYSLRCVPQILGPILDEMSTTQNVLEAEVNSVNDNPVIELDSEYVFHGGNFHGDYVSFAMDKLRIALTKLGMLGERQLNYLLNDKLNGKLPPFVNMGVLGLNFGIQGIQYTATSNTAENQTLSTPMYVHSIPSNNDNQDIVSMGANSALLTSRVANNCFEILAIELLAIVQAIDCLNAQESISSKSLEIYEKIRAIVPSFKEDQPMFGPLAEIKNLMLNNS